MTAIRIIAVIALCGISALLGFAIYVNIDNLVGAFSNGPPYYGRTTNIDKWANPIPFLVIFDTIITAASYFAIGWALRNLKNRPRQEE